MVDTIVGLTPSLDADAFVLYPNPTQQQVNFRIGLASTGAYCVHVRNHLGQMLMQQKGEKWNGEEVGQLDLGTLPGGIYFLELEIDGLRITRKLMLQ